ncbi:hypothetical protein [Noviherbaspirillum suwonense]|jgi:hypothetical protein|uniref:Uncharacterized protein n=1 Tax=Noviherbaspirillum suwonense TaxID=1224511 RepID=A0ABY1PYG3_9BURK|nr:hypothetical protein [Noviherbaspirillum suwonense]SMP53097.1 hypothetical protein SAMN06295970_103243 [Noviherbaspirillum suwonense]
MALLNNTAPNAVDFDRPQAGFMLRVGRREMQIRREVRRSQYSVNPIIDCRPGDDPGHLQMLLFNRWTVVLAKAKSTH